jgi:hypothetical protein
MFADPLSLQDVAATAIDSSAFYGTGAQYLSFVCTGRSPTNSTYRYTVSSSHYIDLFIGHQYGKRNRFTVRLTENELVTDPIDSTKNSVKSSTAYIVIDRSLLGAGTNERHMQHILANVLFTPTGSTPMIDKVTGGET